ncbi:MAG TPA: NTP transferase domain-containing protein [Patescibacteria group bacterium]|nr:NTP transferase domain-containing protein [Patescibacteria group bacterium]
MTSPGTTAAVILAAGAGSRFGGGKLVATIGGRPILALVVDAARSAGLEPIVVVGPPGGLLDHLDLGVVRRAVNPHPDEGLSGSVRVGLRELEFETDVDAAVILLGDQPRVRADVLARLLGAPRASWFVAPRHAEDAAPNPILVRRAGWRLADELVGDRGFGPLLAGRPDVVTWIPVEGANPDIDTRADLATALERAWGDRVRANREQVDRVREVPDGPDFYGPVASHFRDDPDRTGDAVLDRLRARARPDDTWLDIGAGAGRYALPLAGSVREVIAVEPSEGMRAALGEIAAGHGIENVRLLAARWPMDAFEAPTADVALIAHVGYDVEAIGPFLDALEAAARRLCVAVLMERQPSSIADVLWPPVHGEARIPLPALPEFVELLRGRGNEPAVEVASRTPRRFGSRDELVHFLRRQLWIAERGEKEGRFHAALDAVIDDTPDGFGLVGQGPLQVGIVTWAPSG